MRSRFDGGEHPSRLQAGALASAYVGVSVVLWRWWGLTVDLRPPDTWDGSWHLISLDYLRNNLLAGLLYLHAQPPLHNVYVSLFWKAFYPDPSPWLHAANIALGSALAAAVYWLGVRLTGRRWAGLVLGLFWLCHPAPYIYAASWLYEIPSALLAVLLALAGGRFLRQPRAAASIGLFSALNVMVLLRAAFQPLLVPIAVLAGLFRRPQRWKAIVCVALLSSLPLAGWLAKNYWLYGLASTSSWSGMNFMGPVLDHYTGEERAALAEAGLIEPAAALRVWKRPHRYQPFGFTKTSEVPLLNRNDYHNINIIDISNMYMRNALHLIRHRPLLYLLNLEASYRLYCLSSSRDPNVIPPRLCIAPWEKLWTYGVMGKGLTQFSAQFLGRDHLNSWLYPVLPLALAGYAAAAAKRCRLRLDAWRAWLRADCLMAACIALIAYNTFVSVVGDYGENARFSFAVEPVLFPVLAALVLRVGLARRQ